MEDYDSNTEKSYTVLVKELQAQRELIVSNYQMIKSIRRTMRVSVVLNILKLLIIFVPIIWAMIYLPSIVEGYINNLSSASGIGDALNLPQGLDFGQIQQLLER